MGFYINEVNGDPLPRHGKAEALIEHGAEETSIYRDINDIPENKALVAVVDNVFFDAAMFVDSQQSLDLVLEERVRPVQCVLMDYTTAARESGFDEFIDKL